MALPADDRADEPLAVMAAGLELLGGGHAHAPGRADGLLRAGRHRREHARLYRGLLGRLEQVGVHRDGSGVGWGKEKSRLRAGSTDPSGAALQVPAGAAVAAIRAEFRGRAARRGRHATIVAGGGAAETLERKRRISAWRAPKLSSRSREVGVRGGWVYDAFGN